MELWLAEGWGLNVNGVGYTHAVWEDNVRLLDYDPKISQKMWQGFTERLEYFKVDFEVEFPTGDGDEGSTASADQAYGLTA